MPIVNIKLLAGRNTEKKRLLAEKVTEAIAESLQVDKKNVWISIEDLPHENFAQAGVLAADRNKA